MKSIFSIFLVLILLTGCTSNSGPGEIKKSPSSEALPSEVGAKCNVFSPQKKILLNSPCPDDEFKDKKIVLKGKIINAGETVSLNILQSGKVMQSEKIIPVPSSAAGSYKLLDQTITINSSLKGKLIMNIEQGKEKVSVLMTI